MVVPDSFWPSTHSRRSQDRAYLVNLVCLRGPWEQWPQGVQLRHDAATGPLVYGRVVVGRPQKHFGCAVPTATHVTDTANLIAKPTHPYHRVDTYSVYGGFDRTSLARPKSATLTTSPFTCTPHHTTPSVTVTVTVSPRGNGIKWHNTYKHIFRLHITVKKSMFVHKSQPLEYLIHNISNFRLRKVTISIFH